MISIVPLQPDIIRTLILRGHVAVAFMSEMRKASTRFIVYEIVQYSTPIGMD